MLLIMAGYSLAINFLGPGFEIPARPHGELRCRPRQVRLLSFCESIMFRDFRASVSSIDMNGSYASPPRVP